MTLVKHFDAEKHPGLRDRFNPDAWETVATFPTQQLASAAVREWVTDGTVDWRDVEVVSGQGNAAAAKSRPAAPPAPPLPIRRMRTREQVTALVWLAGMTSPPTNCTCPYCEKKITVWDPLVTIAGSSLIHSECIDQLVIDALWLDAQCRKESTNDHHAQKPLPQAI